MPEQRAISELTTQPTANLSDLFEVSVVNAQSASGYSSKKMSAEVIAEGIVNTYNYPTAMPAMQNRSIIGAINALLSNFAPIYDATLTYEEDDLVTYNGVLYKANQDISTAEEWNSSHWTQTTVAESGGGGGGGGDASKLELTQLEYDALTYEQKHNGIMYFITDANGDGSQFQPVIYSEIEREIGVWTDGKPLYERTIIYDNQTTISDGYTPIASLSNIDHIDIISGGVINSSDDSYYSLPYVFENKSTSWYYDNGNLGIRVANDTWSSDWDIFVTIQYTKTTDTAGSGTWTPQGVPAVHYSTDEQVIGTWIDGNTLYEKTFDLGSSVEVSSGSWYTTNISASNIAFIVDITAYNADGTIWKFLGAGCSGSYVTLWQSRGSGIGVRYITLQYTKTTL